VTLYDRYNYHPVCNHRTGNLLLLCSGGEGGQMNNLIKQLQSAKQQGYLQGVAESREVTEALWAVALNEKFHFGANRIAEVKNEADELWKTEIQGNAEMGARHLVQRLDQIQGVKCERTDKR
jgi:hypothetical protein